MLTNYIVAIRPDGIPEIFDYSCDVIDDITLVMEYEEEQLIFKLLERDYEIIENVGTDFDKALRIVESYS